MNKPKKRFKPIKIISLSLALSMFLQLIPVSVTASAQIFDEEGIPINLQVLNTSNGKPIINTLYEVTGNGETKMMGTGLDGIASITGLIPGEYVVTEYDIQQPYLRNSTPMNVTVIDGETAQLSRESDSAKVTLTMKKVDLKTNGPLSGAIFEVSNESNEVVAEITSGTDGIAKIEGLAPGVYFVKEIKAPSGYILSSDEFQLNMFYINNETPIIEGSKTFTGTAIRGQVKLFSKETGSDIPIIGASYRLLTGAGQPMGLFTTDENGIISINDLDFGDYIFSEISVPLGYSATYKDYEFSIVDFEPVALNLTYDYTKFDISLRDIASDEQLQGAQIEVLNSDGVVVKSFETTDVPQRINGLPIGVYTISQVSPADGYVLTEAVQFTLISTTDTQSVVLHNDFTKINISNRDINTNKEVESSMLQIVQDGNILHQWESTNEKHEITKLPVGKYVLKEMSAPLGYATSSDVAFEVLPMVDIQEIIMKKDHTKVSISIVDVNTDKFLPGTTVQIFDNEGNIVYEWTSSDKPFNITAVPVGEYTLREYEAPDGYISSDDIKFTVLPTAEPLLLKVNKDYTKIQISLTDVTTTNEIVGASLRVTDSEGHILEEWISKATPHVIYGLTSDKYTLTQVKVKGGYIRSEDIVFEVKPDGTIKSVEMKNDYTKIQIENFDSNTKNPVTGITFQIIDSEDKVIQEWESTNSPYETKYLPVGKYILREITSADGYVASNDVEFTISAIGEVQPITTYHSLTKVEVSLKNITTDGYISGAILRIVDKNGNVVTEWESENLNHVILGLTAGSYTLSQIDSTEGYIPSEDIAFTINSSKTLTKVEMKNDYTKIQIKNINTDNNLQVVGTSFELLDSGNVILREWKSTDKPFEINYLPLGQYHIVETDSADGYVTSKPVYFNVSATGETSVVETNHFPTKVQISVLDIGTEKEITGMTLTILDSEGKVVRTWVSSGETQVIKALPIGTYTLIKTNAPDGYLQSENIEFEVENSEDVRSMISKIDFTKVQLNVLDENTLGILDGETLQIIDKDDIVVQELVARASMLIERLPFGIYKLRVKGDMDKEIFIEDGLFEVGSSSSVKPLTIRLVEAPIVIPEEPIEEPKKEEPVVEEPIKEETIKTPEENINVDSDTEELDKNTVEKFPPTGVESSTSWLVGGTMTILIGVLLLLSTMEDKKKYI